MGEDLSVCSEKKIHDSFPSVRPIGESKDTNTCNYYYMYITEFINVLNRKVTVNLK